MDNWDRLEVEGDTLASVTSLVLRKSETYSNYPDCKIGWLLLNTINASKRKKKKIASGQSFNNLEQIVLF